MKATEFRALFMRAMEIAKWPQEDIDYVQEMIRKDWADGPGFPRDGIEMPPAEERKQMWIATMRFIAGEDVPVNEHINADIRAEIERARAAEVTA